MLSKGFVDKSALNELIKKGAGEMTIEELKKALDKIPKTGAINKARRLAIQKQIYELMEKQ